MPVDHAALKFVVVLKLDPIPKRTFKVSEVQLGLSRLHAAEQSFLFHDLLEEAPSRQEL